MCDGWDGHEMNTSMWMYIHLPSGCYHSILSMELPELKTITAEETAKEEENSAKASPEESNRRTVPQILPELGCAPPPFLLSPRQIQDFIVRGYLELAPSAFLCRDVHENIYEACKSCFDTAGDPGNNILPDVPDLFDVFEAPEVVGALTSLLGAGYMFHAHRRCHETIAGTLPQAWHKDTYKGRQYQPNHRPEWLMALYFPQKTPPSLGPTELLPGTQYFRGDYGDHIEAQKEQWASRGVPMSCEQGTIVLIHYDIWHRGGHNKSNPSQRRMMIKLQFSRMEVPCEVEKCFWDGSDTRADWLGAVCSDLPSATTVAMPVMAALREQVNQLDLSSSTLNRQIGSIVQSTLANFYDVSERKSMKGFVQQYISEEISKRKLAEAHFKFVAQRRRIWADMWCWLHGDLWSNFGASPEPEALEELLYDTEESIRLSAAYHLALSEAGVEILLDCLVTAGSKSSHNLKGRAPVTVRRTAVYGLIAAGSRAVPALQKLLCQPLDSRVRSELADSEREIQVPLANAESIQDSVGDGETHARRAVEGFCFELSHPATNANSELLYCATMVIANGRGTDNARLLLQCAANALMPMSCRIVAMEGLGWNGRYLEIQGTMPPVFHTSLCHSCEDLRCAAALALARLAHDPMVRVAINEDSKLLAKVIHALHYDSGRYVRAYSLETLTRLLAFGSDDKIICEAVMAKCEQYGRGHALTYLSKLCRKESMDQTAVRLRLARHICTMQRCPITSPTNRW